MIDGAARTSSSLFLLAILLTWESFAPFFSYFVGVPAARTRHALRNLTLGLINAALSALVCVGLWFSATRWADVQHFGLFNWVSLPPWAHLVGVFLLLDAWTYLWHRLNHRIPFLWRFHRVHHSDTRMDVTTASRFHVGEIVLSCLLRVPVIALVGVEFWQLTFYEGLMFLVTQFHHANVGPSERVDKCLRVLVVTPFMHKVHHSRWRPETNSNYSALFSVWDRLFHTFRLREDPQALRFGLEELDEPKFQTLKGLFTTPLKSDATSWSP